MSPPQTKGMKRIFEEKRYLDGGEREQIAKKFNLTPAQVKRTVNCNLVIQLLNNACISGFIHSTVYTIWTN